MILLSGSYFIFLVLFLIKVGNTFLHNFLYYTLFIEILIDNILIISHIYTDFYIIVYLSFNKHN
ncbi:MAG: hypothetical protein JWQ14_460 [Adhaeribacter sp.]|nr:hypothetical protein [Adhaeribacter sp.]